METKVHIILKSSARVRQPFTMSTVFIIQHVNEDLVNFVSQVLTVEDKLSFVIKI